MEHFKESRPPVYTAVSKDAQELILGFPWTRLPREEGDEPITYLRVVDPLTPDGEAYWRTEDVEVEDDTLCMASPYQFLFEDKGKENPVPMFEGNHFMAFSKKDERAAFSFVVCLGPYLDDAGREQYGFYAKPFLDPRGNCKEERLSIGELCKEYIFYLVDDLNNPAE